MLKPIESVILGAGDRGYYTHGEFAMRYPHKLKFVAVAEPNQQLRDRFGERHGIPVARRYATWEDLIAAGQLAPVLMNTTPDRVHAASAIASLEAGYDILLEKPMATTPEECLQIVRTAESKGRILQVHHGYRYNPFQATINQIVNSGRLGDIMEYHHRENVAFFHMAHSYVRGNWRRNETSGPIILTKCCHDLDLIVWNLNSMCKRLVSFGSLRHYRSENARPEYPERCTDGCPTEINCPYSAPRHYLLDDYIARMFVQSMTTDTSKEGILKALREGPYGRCVYRCDNDVMDNQVVLMEMENGINATLSFHGFSHDGGRSLRFQGTKGTLIAEALQKEIIVHDHLTGRKDIINIGRTTGGHGGGDDGVILDFIDTLNSGKSEGRTSGRISLESHLMAFAAEESRLSGQPTDMDTYRKKVEAHTIAAP